MPRHPGQPYLSVVTSSRNDNHGGDMFTRMQSSLSSLITQLERYELDSEIVLVDYNPPADKPLLKEALDWPAQTRFCTIRTIVVPGEVHRRFKDSDKTPFHGALAQNIGIRRAKGEFILSAGVDILYANELIEFLGKRNLDPGRIYRTDRLDVARQAAAVPSLDDRLEFCREHVLFIHTRDRMIPVLRKKKHLRSASLSFRSPHPNRKDLFRLHFNGGDFTLMSRDSWSSLRGWPQVDVLGLGAEIILFGSAYLNGIWEEVLSEALCIYHIDHDSRWRLKRGLHPFVTACFYCLPDAVAVGLLSLLAPVRRKAISAVCGKPSRKVDATGVDWVGFDGLKRILLEMYKGTRPRVYNDEDWGLGDETVPEYLVCEPDLQ